MKPKVWAQALSFLSLACAFGWALYYVRGWVWPGRDATWWWGAIMWSPALAAGVCRAAFAFTDGFPLFGKRWGRGFGFYLAPMGLLGALAWVLGDRALLRDLGTGLPLTALLRTLGEELGWRGFLQPLLAPRFSAPRRWLLTGVAWELWHIPYRLGGGLLPHMVQAAFTVALACLLGWALEKSRVLIVPITLHLWANLVMEMGATACFASIAAVPFWIFLLLRSEFHRSRQLS